MTKRIKKLRETQLELFSLEETLSLETEYTRSLENLRYKNSNTSKKTKIQDKKDSGDT